MSNNEEVKSGLISFDNTGLHIASKEQIKTYLKDAISKSYGSDINFNPNYPDGIFVEALATGFRDVFESLQGLYNSFNVRNSSGVMLDMLSNLINVHRKTKTNASVTLDLNIEKDMEEIGQGNLQLKDKNNLIWKNKDIVTGNSGAKRITFNCERLEEVENPLTGDFVILAPQTSNIKLAQDNSAAKFIQGNSDEDDISLRSRVMNNSIYNSVSIKENLIKMIFENEYVKDVKIYNNDLDADLILKLKSGSNIIKLPSTQLMVLIRYKEELLSMLKDTVKQDIAKIISEYKGLSVISYDIGQDFGITWDSTKFEKSNEDGFDIKSGNVKYYNSEYKNTVYYREAQKKTGVVITVNIFKGENYNSSSGTDGTRWFIINKICEYLRDLGIGEDLVSGKLIGYLYSNSENQFGVTSLSLGSGATTIVSNDEYFPSIEDYVEGGNSTLKIVISEN